MFEKWHKFVFKQPDLVKEILFWIVAIPITTLYTFIGFFPYAAYMMLDFFSDYLNMWEETKKIRYWRK